MKYRPRFTPKDTNQTPLLHDLGRMLGGWSKIEGEGLTQNAWRGMCAGVPVTVMDNSNVGGLICDTLFIARGVTHWVEIKDTGKREKLTPGERIMSELHPEIFHVVETAEEYYQTILDAING